MYYGLYSMCHAHVTFLDRCLLIKVMHITFPSMNYLIYFISHRQTKIGSEVVFVLLLFSDGMWYLPYPYAIYKAIGSSFPIEDLYSTSISNVFHCIFSQGASGNKYHVEELDCTGKFLLHLQ
jgi:hypothetical protein